MEKTITDLLINRAKKAQSYSQARYSDFQVGAAILTHDNQIFTGCNIESASYGLTICAERVALTKALSEGYTRFKSIAIIGPGEDICSPCGACRQMLYDYAPEINVIMTHRGELKIYPLKELLPLAFEDKRLKNK
ncbi:MAG: cytidine deaminase [Calditrichae bacterium]|nr:cytidine deaminase [Calditrichia bacterium]